MKMVEQINKYEDRVSIYREVIKLWGKDAQILMAVEELSELIQVLLRLRRKNRVVTYNDLASEIVDVRLMIEQIIEMYSIYDLVESKEEEKIIKLKKYMKEAKDKNGKTNKH